MIAEPFHCLVHLSFPANLIEDLIVQQVQMARWELPYQEEDLEGYCLSWTRRELELRGGLIPACVVFVVLVRRVPIVEGLTA